jgi:hypothetical protein
MQRVRSQHWGMFERDEVDRGGYGCPDGCNLIKLGGALRRGGLRKNVVRLPTPTWHHVLVLASTSGARRLSAHRLLACLLTATGSIEGKERALRSGC